MCNHYRDARQIEMTIDGVPIAEMSELPRDIYPNRPAPVIVHVDGRPTWRVMRWGFPKLDKPGATLLTNCRIQDPAIAAPRNSPMSASTCFLRS